MSVSRLLHRDDSALVVIDVQEAYRGKTVEHDRMVERVCRLIRAARLLAVPIVVTEQYPKGIGRTQREVAECLPEAQPILEKMTMSCCGQPQFVAAVERLGRRQLVVCGIEAHACVNQTVHQLLERGYEVHLPRDAVSARFESDLEVAWQKMTTSGAVPSSTEMALLEWIRSSEDPLFKDIHRLIK
ncbi:MAG TPA: hydrolase [Chromatiales bacterium]|nr:hydrolase [Chromatiales bacterium]